MPKKWGKVARRGAGSLEMPEPTGKDEPRYVPGAPDAWEPDVWERVVDDAPTDTSKKKRGDRGAGLGVARTSDAARPSRKVDKAVAEELANATPKKRRALIESQLAEATHAYERARFDDARRMLRKLLDLVPTAPSVRELYGLTLYRLGKWKQALLELDAFELQTGSTDQLPVQADCHRALKNHKMVDAIWEKLRLATPDAEVLAEGRMVVAGSLADRDRLDEAIGLLSKSARPLRNPSEHHLRTWYALADLYERSGDIVRARELFARVAQHEPEFGDIQDRLHALD